MVAKNINEVQKLLTSFIDCGKVKRNQSMPLNQATNEEKTVTARYREMLENDPYLKNESLE